MTGTPVDRALEVVDSLIAKSFVVRGETVSGGHVFMRVVTEADLLAARAALASEPSGEPETEPEPDEPDIRACRMCNGAGCNWCAESGRDR